MRCISGSAGAVAALLLLNGCVRHFHATGVVVAVNRPAGELTISHRAIGSYMPPMAMPFRVVHRADLENVSPGSRVRFDLRVGRGSSVITKLRADAAPAVTDFAMPAAAHTIAIGDRVPDFQLIDERGRSVSPVDLLGHVTAIEFIYTRCPLPDVCPRLSANFALLQKRFGRDVRLLSVTIDPEHDTPGVLRDYARRWGADDGVWRFLTGPPDAVRRFAGSFGLVYFAEEGAITHNSSASLIGPAGRLLARIEGSSYTSQQLVDLVSHILLRSPEGSHP